mmetsp:Transcript_27192/g.45486  ORF Transcript_27192/g.45486 Transcript_27192/m.45486 type:complete len:330 (+) Transcript_27192:304-1293(+)
MVRRKTFRVERSEARPVTLQQLPSVPTHITEEAVPIRLTLTLAAVCRYFWLFGRAILCWTLATTAACTMLFEARSKLLVTTVVILVYIPIALITLIVVDKLIVIVTKLVLHGQAHSFHILLGSRFRPCATACGRALRRKLSQFPRIDTVRLTFRFIVPPYQHCTPGRSLKHVSVFLWLSRHNIHDCTRPPGTQFGGRRVAPEHLEPFTFFPVVRVPVPAPIEQKLWGTDRGRRGVHVHKHVEQVLSIADPVRHCALSSASQLSAQDVVRRLLALGKLSQAFDTRHFALLNCVQHCFRSSLSDVPAQVHSHFEVRPSWFKVDVWTVVYLT